MKIIESDLSSDIGKNKLERQHVFLMKCNQKDEGKVYYVCTHHDFEEKTRKKKIKHGKDLRNVTEVSVTFQSPTGVGIKSMNNGRKSESKGVGSERLFNRNINKISDNISHLDETKSKNNQTLVNAATSNASLAMSSFDIIDELMKENERLKKENDEIKKKHEDIRKGKVIKDEILTGSTVGVSYKEMIRDDDGVKRRTGFQSLDHMLAYIIIICNGNHKKITEKKTRLT